MDTRTDRQLAAIMFTDIVGYTSLMQRNEKKAAAQRARHREVFQEQHARFDGRILQYYGDGTLSVFNSAVKASECAIQIQRLLQADDPLPLRIGLHIGDIVFDQTEVYGDGVNVASRIESLGVAGSVLISASLNEELKNQESISTVSLGSFEFKNVTAPTEVFAISNPGLVLPQSSDLNGKLGKSRKSVAVMPFVNMSADADNEYFSDGMTEEIINALSKIESLKVTSRTSSFYFKNKALPIKKIAAELNVSAILEGSVRVSGKAMRITAQLIEAAGDYHFWSETWDRQLDDIFETQDEISLLIADKLREQFGHFDIQEHLVEKQTLSITAYELLLKGRYHRNRWNPEDINKAIGYFEQAIDIDPEYAESYVDLADCYSFLGTTGFMPYDEAWQKSHGYLLVAQKLDKNLAGVFYQLSNEAFFIEGNHQKSLTEMRKAIVAEPNNATAQEFLSFLYIVAGDRERSREHLDTALAINPKSEETQFFHAYFHYMLEDFEQADILLDKCLQANDKNIPAHSVKAFCLLCLKKYDEAIAYHENIPQEVVIPEEQNGVRLLAHTLKNDAAKASEFLEKIKEQCKGHNAVTAEAFIFFYHVITGAKDNAFDWLDTAIKNKSFAVPLRLNDPIIKPLRTDPRYAELQQIIYSTSKDTSLVNKKKPLLAPELAEEYVKKLLAFIRDEKPYLDPELTLRSLSEQLDMQPNQLSWLINECLVKNYNDFINHYRIETFKSLAQDPANASITIMGLAYDSGFNSKTTFNKSFKKETGLTPKQFLKG
jgi:TolB-like protein/class 3 adenylate cyclase/AraC-like DNA-binding protein/Tfp pilus assembly protein PilF